MASTAAQAAAAARNQLETALARGVTVPMSRNRFPVANRTQRNSAVLMLFGALDRVAAAPACEVGTVGPELDVLLMRRSNGLRNHAGQISFPGGGVEPSDANRAATALREAHEETGLDPSGVDVLGHLEDAHIPVSNYLVTPVLGWWRLPSEVSADYSESVEVFRVPVAELIHPDSRGTSVLQFDGGVHTGPAFKLGPQLGGHTVWGFTAMMLSGLFDAVGWSVPWDTERTFEVTR
ncbi:MAG: CoA pyrophosphatase [Leucobacter sp.]|nr:CoA pyrophosphatase [Leucobacter sp.]